MSRPPSWSRLPEPRAEPFVGHLGRWGREPLAVLDEGAARGPLFRMRLWRPALVGFRPDWNRLILRDLDTFRSRGSLSGLTPYLSGGVVLTDAPEHRLRRDQLNPHVHSRTVGQLRDRLDAVVDGARPTGPFEAVAWASRTVRVMLNAVLFGSRIDDSLLAAFLSPLHRPLPLPLLPRRRLFRQLHLGIAKVVADPPEGSLAASFAGVDGAAEELRIALAAGYDTTAHTLAWALWQLAADPAWQAADALPQVIDETLRLYPAGWLGSRVTSRPVDVDGLVIPARTLVLYSPYLTHRDPELWSDPARFDPGRFERGRPAWGFIPFAAGERTCLGAHLARLMLRRALVPFCTGALTVRHGDPAPTAGLTLRPRGRLVVHHARRNRAPYGANQGPAGRPSSR